MFMKSKIFFLRTAVIVGFFLLIILPVEGNAGVWGMDCHMWRKFDNTDHRLYLNGLMDGLIFSKNTIQGEEISDTSIEHFIKSVDQFCGNYANELIPVPFALKVISMKLKGVDDESIQKELENLRRLFYAVRKDHIKEGRPKAAPGK
jgi:hypothetical protein